MTRREKKQKKSTRKKMLEKRGMTRREKKREKSTRKKMLEKGG